MDTGNLIIRKGIVASLLLGLCVAGLPPCLGSGADCPSFAARSTARSCCCRGECGGHCRMACCQRPAPPQDRTPAPAKPVDDAHVWGIATALFAPVDASTISGFEAGRRQLGLESGAAPSLLSLGVRINA